MNTISTFTSCVAYKPWAEISKSDESDITELHDKKATTIQNLECRVGRSKKQRETTVVGRMGAVASRIIFSTTKALKVPKPCNL